MDLEKSTKENIPSKDDIHQLSECIKKLSMATKARSNEIKEYKNEMKINRKKIEQIKRTTSDSSIEIDLSDIITESSSENSNSDNSISDNSTSNISNNTSK